MGKHLKRLWRKDTGSHFEVVRLYKRTSVIWRRQKNKKSYKGIQSKTLRHKKRKIYRLSSSIARGVGRWGWYKRDFLNWEHSKGAGGLVLPRGKTTHAGDVCQVAEHKEPSFPPFFYNMYVWHFPDCFPNVHQNRNTLHCGKLLVFSCWANSACVWLTRVSLALQVFFCV